METTHEIIPQLYSELTVGHPDFIDLAERCELLTQILLDCQSVAQYQPVCRCLVAYLDALKHALSENMSEMCILELTANEAPEQQQAWLTADSDVQCDYCHATAISLMQTTQEPNAETLAGLLHDLVSYMTYELKAPRFAPVQSA